MSFIALSLAVDAAYALPPLEDEEFGLSWGDLEWTWSPDFVLTWALYLATKRRCDVCRRQPA